MAVELGWFIVLPVVNELAVWWRRRGSMRWNRATRRTAAACFGLLLILLWPWQVTVRVPGMLGALQAQALYAPVAAQVTGPMPQLGRQVRAGEPLLRLQAPQLEEALALARAKADELRWQLDQQAFDAQLREAGVALQRRWESATAEVQGLQQQIARLTLRAPFDGRVAETDDDAPPHAWVSAGEPLLELVAPRGSKVDVYLDEDAIGELRIGEAATFVPAQPEAPRVHCRVARVDAVPLSNLDVPGLASVHGGPIPAQRLADGRLVPLQPTFHARLDDCDLAQAPVRELPGTALLSSPRRSLAHRALARALAIWHREAAL
jgi:putative peptide zinc metalloprotease protein